MFCKKCGTEIQTEDELCPLCKKEQQYYVENEKNLLAAKKTAHSYSIASDSYEKYAWFAPTAVVLSFVLSIIINALFQRLLQGFMDDSGTESIFFVDEYLFTLAAQSLLGLIIPILSSFGIYALATLKAETIMKKQTYLFALLPVVCHSFIFTVSGAIQTSFSEKIGLQKSAIIIIIVRIALAVISAILSYFLCKNSLNEISPKKAVKNERQNNYNPSVEKDVTSYDSLNSDDLYANNSVKCAKTKVSTGLLCFFLGEFGIHRFYVGKVGTGLLWMFTGGLLGIGWLIDLLMIIFGGFKDSDGRNLS